MKTYKILLVTHEFPPNIIGGMGIHAYNLAIELAKLGQEVSILTSKNTPRSFSKKEFKFEHLKIIRLSHSVFPNSREGFLKSAIEYINNNPYYHVIHAHNFLDYSKVKTPALKIQKVHINPTYGYQLEAFNNLLEAFYFKKIKTIKMRFSIKKSFENSNLVIYNSKLSKKISESIYGKNFESVVIYNGVNYKEFQSGSKKKYRKEGFLFVGGNKKRKGADILVALAKLFPNQLFKVCGCTRSGFLSKLSRSRIPDNIRILGFLSRNRIKKEYKRALALIHPARYESFGNVVLESLACGTPVLVSSSNFCGASEILNSKVGATFNPNNLDEIKEKIYDYLKDPDKYDPKKCIKLAKRYSWKKTAVETVKIIDQYLNT
ncbi:glycosyltransferase family 4 protein [bacterium]|nr:glycosyltransferase family 4 protein [bacterium]